jgi:hypothetical protein
MFDNGFPPFESESLASLGAAAILACRSVERTQRLSRARQHFSQMKWLAHIIVGYQFETDYSVDRILSSADHDDAASAACMQLTQQIESVFDAEIQIKQDQILVSCSSRDIIPDPELATAVRNPLLERYRGNIVQIPLMSRNAEKRL